MKTRPGWYPDTTRPGTQRYWDGDAWTDNVAPIAPPPSSDGSLMRALVVMLGILMAGAVIWGVYAFVTADDDAGCAKENLERTMDGLPTKDCG